MKPETLELLAEALPAEALPDDELVRPEDVPSEAHDGPDGDLLEDTDAPEDAGDRAGDL